MTEDDVRVVRHLALDTCPRNRRMAFRGLVAAEEGFVATSGVMAAADCSKGTALGLLKDLVALRLAEVVPKDKDAKGLKVRQQPYRIRLADGFAWLSGQ